MYVDDFNPVNWKDPMIDAFYKDSDYHRMYMGEIVSIKGIKAYQL